MKKGKIFFLLSLFSIVVSLPFLKFQKSIILQSKNLLFPADFAVDEEGLIYVVDSKAADIKVFDKKGKFLKTLGRKGAGPGEFLRPFQISIFDDQICVVDSGLYRYLLLTKDTFQLKTSFPYLTVGTMEFNVKLSKDRIISGDGYIKGDRYWTGVILNREGKVLALLIRSPFSRRQPENMMTYSLVDASPDGLIYAVIIKELKIHQFNSRGEPLRTFGEAPRGYKPLKGYKKIVQKLKRGNFQETRKILENWRKSATWIVGLGATEKGLFLLAKDFDRNRNVWNLWYQYYTKEGKNVILKKHLKFPDPGDDLRIRVKFGPMKKYLYILRLKATEGVEIEKFKVITQ